MRAGAVALASTGAGMAETEGWTLFVDRCLTPMSEVERPVTEGLTEGGAARFAEVMDDGDLPGTTYVAGENLILQVVPEGDGQFLGCALLDETAEVEATVAAFTAWRDAEVAAERLRETESLLGQFYHSTTWREPKLRVGVMTGRDPETGRKMAMLSVSDTDLES